MNRVGSMCGKYTIHHEDQLLGDPGIVEEKYNAKYIGEFCYHNGTQGWLNQPMALFYTEKAHPEGSNYIGVMLAPPVTGRNSTLIIVDGISAAENEWYGVLSKVTNEIIYSAFRHDYQVLGELVADGGPEYLHSSGHPFVTLTIIKDKLSVQST